MRHSTSICFHLPSADCTAARGSGLCVLAQSLDWCLTLQVIDLKGELANSKAGQAAIKQAVETAAKEQAASTAREKALKVPCSLQLSRAM